MEGQQLAEVLALENAALKERVAELQTTLANAIVSIDSWAIYASDYFRVKHNLTKELAMYRHVLNGQ